MLNDCLQAKSDEITHLSKLAAKLETDLTRSKVNMEDEIKIQVKYFILSTCEVPCVWTRCH